MGESAYKQSGVDYAALDPFKRMALMAARETGKNLKHHDCDEVAASRGESAYVIEFPDFYLAHVEEGLGTKDQVAEAVYRQTGQCRFDAVAQDAVAMILNDLATTGAEPLSIMMHCAVGDSSWFSDVVRARALIDGWKQACGEAGVSWGGGETPTLKGSIAPGAIVLSGSATGIIRPKIDLLSAARIAEGDRILLVESSGIHANGLTLARSVAARLSNGYQTPVPGEERTFGEALLRPTILYAPLLHLLHVGGVEAHYAVNITGHGWRKLMRASRPLAYRISTIPPIPPIFPFLQHHTGIDDREMYATFNMGAGFALFLHPMHVRFAILAANNLGLVAVDAGVVEPSDGRRVIIEPLNIEFCSSDLDIR